MEANYKPPAAAGSFHDVWRGTVTPAMRSLYGTPGTFTRKSNSETLPLVGVWDANYHDLTLVGLGEPGVESSLPVILFAVADLPGLPPVHGDQWSDGQKTWYFIQIEPEPSLGTIRAWMSLDPPQ